MLKLHCVELWKANWYNFSGKSKQEIWNFFSIDYRELGLCETWCTRGCWYNGVLRSIRWLWMCCWSTLIRIHNNNKFIYIYTYIHIHYHVSNWLYTSTHVEHLNAKEGYFCSVLRFVEHIQALGIRGQKLAPGFARKLIQLQHNRVSMSFPRVCLRANGCAQCSGYREMG